MYVQRLLQINMATLAALGALLLGMGQGDVVLPLAVSLAAISSVWLTDITGRFRLNRVVANVGAVLALLASLPQLRRSGGQLDILAIAQMLVYLQIILLFQQKDRRVYWQLVMLSLLQVVVAAALNQGVWFGLLLMIYMLVGLSAMAMLFLYSQWSQHRPAEGISPLVAATGRWPMAGQQPEFSGAVSGRLGAGIVRELVGRLATMELGTLLLTLLLFFTVPRFGQTAWRGAIVGPQRVVGFSERVVLGELGQTFESREEVLRIKLTKAGTGELYFVQGGLYLRGAILSYYDEGQWEDRTRGRRLIRPLPWAGDVPKEDLVIQEITIEPLDQPELFCVWPFVQLQPNVDLVLRGERLLRRGERLMERFRYTLGTTAFVGGVQVSLVPCDRTPDLEPLRRMPRVSQLRQLSELARGWLEETGVPAENRFLQAQVLERKLRDPRNGFSYSLEGQRRDEAIDPIEDFVANNRRGHCEYFATALAMMLRSQGIPSRMVLGYKCDEFNRLSQCYHVRQLHAHTWVEAYLEPEHIPAALLDAENPSRWDHGGWLRLEPTPGTAASYQAEAGVSFIGRIERRFQRLQSLWSNYVMEMDRRRQREAIYKPLGDAFRHLRDPQWWRGLLREVADALRLGRLGSVGYWLGLCLLSVAILALVVLVRRRLCRLLRWSFGRLAGRGRAADGGHRTEVEFYRRLEALLARRDLVRARGQTQREFALAAGQRIAAATGQEHLAPLPGQVVDAFYRVRFGRLVLDSPQSLAVEHALAELARYAEGG